MSWIPHCTVYQSISSYEGLLFFSRFFFLSTRFICFCVTFHLLFCVSHFNNFLGSVNVGYHKTKAYGIISVKTLVIQTFCSTSNEISPSLVTRSLGNKSWNVGKKNSGNPSKNTTDKGEKRKKKGNYKTSCIRRKHKN